jgi:hypothetical protein
MAYAAREILATSGRTLTITCTNMSRVGINLGGSWAGSVSFFSSRDFVTYTPALVAPHPTDGTAVSSTTTNGSWEFDVTNAASFRIQPTLTSGSVQATLAAALDESYHEAFQPSTSRYINQESGVNSTNMVTVAAQTGNAWRLRFLVVSFRGGTPTTAQVTIQDGASSVLWKMDFPLAQGQVNVPLPPISFSDTGAVVEGGIVGTLGNSMVVSVAAGGTGVISNINAEVTSA